MAGELWEYFGAVSDLRLLALKRTRLRDQSNRFSRAVAEDLAPCINCVDHEENRGCLKAGVCENWLLIRIPCQELPDCCCSTTLQGAPLIIYHQMTLFTAPSLMACMHSRSCGSSMRAGLSCSRNFAALHTVPISSAAGSWHFAHAPSPEHIPGEGDQGTDIDDDFATIE